MTGYSGTPLAKKLGIKDGSVIYAPGAPTEYRELLQPLPAGVRIATAVSASTDIVHLFETERSKLAVALRTLRKKLAPNAAVWVSWPKSPAGPVVRKGASVGRRPPFGDEVASAVEFTQPANEARGTAIAIVAAKRRALVQPPKQQVGNQ